MSSPINFFNKDDPLIDRLNRRDKPNKPPQSTSGKDFVNYLDSDSKRKKEVSSREQVNARRTQGRQPSKPIDKKATKMARSLEELEALDADIGERDELTEATSFEKDPLEESFSDFYRTEEEPTSETDSKGQGWFSEDDSMLASNEATLEETTDLEPTPPTPPKQAPNLLTGLTNLLARQQTESTSSTDHKEHAPGLTKVTPSLFDLSATNRSTAKKTTSQANTSATSNPIAQTPSSKPKKAPVGLPKSITDQAEELEEEPTPAQPTVTEPLKPIAVKPPTTSVSTPTSSTTAHFLVPRHEVKEEEPIQAALTPTPLKKQQPIAESPLSASLKKQPATTESNVSPNPTSLKKRQPIAESPTTPSTSTKRTFEKSTRSRLESDSFTDQLETKQEHRLERKLSRLEETSDSEASSQFAAQASSPAHLQNLNVHSPTTTSDIQQPPPNLTHIQELIDQITDNAYTMKLNGETDTSFEIKNPNSLFDGARIILSTSENARGQFNVTIENLTQLAKNLVEMHGHQASLRMAFETKGLTLHNIFATTGSLHQEISGAQPSSQESFQDRQNQRDGESRNRERRQGQQK